MANFYDVNFRIAITSSSSYFLDAYYVRICSTERATGAVGLNRSAARRPQSPSGYKIV
jgi:hypothetical protein